MAETWWALAACAGMSADPFFPDRHTMTADYRFALSVCNRCPVRLECLTYAIARHEEEGVWGGTSGRQRRGARRFCNCCRARLTPHEVATNLLARSPLVACTSCRGEIGPVVDLTEPTRERATERAEAAVRRQRQRWEPAWRR